jgi:large subunit ribosomal protein L35
VPKMKTHRGAKKRMMVSANGKPRRFRAGKSHLLEHKSATRRRRLRQAAVLSNADRHRVKRLLPYA